MVPTRPRVYTLLGMYHASTNGSDWYTTTGPNQLKRIAHATRVSYQIAAGVYAALSPGIRASECFRSTHLLLRQLATLDPGLLGGVSGWPINRRKALRIANGAHPLEVLVGPKVTTFYRALMGEDVLVVDGHIVNAWMGTDASMTAVRISAADMRQLHQDFDDAIQLARCGVRKFQARVWNQQRAIRNAQRNPDQMGLPV